MYLLSFVLAFEFAGLYRRWLMMRVLAVLLASLGYLLSKTGVDVPIALSIGFFVTELLIACWFLHAELFALRPAGSRASTAFYLSIAAGGAAGTFFVAVVSPLVFRSNYDVPIAFALTAAAALAVTWASGWQQRMLWGVATLLGCALLVVLRVEYGHDSLVRLRNFYGTLLVRQTHTPPQAVTARTLVNGSIQHGVQWFADDFRTGADELLRGGLGRGAGDAPLLRRPAATDRRGGAGRGHAGGVWTAGRQRSSSTRSIRSTRMSRARCSPICGTRRRR